MGEGGTVNQSNDMRKAANVLGGQFTSFAVAYFIAADGQVFVTANFGG